MEASDCRDEVFVERGYEVLGSVVQATQMAQPDPLDFDQLHGAARSAFLTTLDHIRNGSSSRILLIRGEAGCGKTHLIRSLRTQTHRNGEAALAYVHMTSEHGDYRQYLLRQVIRSLSDPYGTRGDERIAPADVTAKQQASTLDLISDALAELLPGGAAEALREADEATLAQLVSDDADELSELDGEDGRPRFDGISLNTLRIFLYRQSTRKQIQRRVGSFLNGEPLGEMDWQKLAALPRDCDRNPMLLLGELARIISATLKAPLVICVDQIEASDITGTNHIPFLNAMGTACELIENVPGLLVLLSCLDSAYDAHAPSLIGSYRHRIEQEPSAVNLAAARSAEEIRQIISRRLKWLYEGVGLEHVPPSSVHPLPENVPEQLQKQHLRKILQQVHGYWEKCSQAGRIIPWQADGIEIISGVTEQERDVDHLRIAWNEYRTNGHGDVSEDDEQQIDLLAWALGEVENELDDGTVALVEREVAQAGHAPLYACSLSLTEPRTPPRNRLVGLCDKDPRGGGLHRQLLSLEQVRATGQVLVVTRSTRFPETGQAGGFKERAEANGDVFVHIDDSGWRTLHAMRLFLAEGIAAYSKATLREWRKTDRPLINLPEISAILQLRRPGVDVPPTPPSKPRSPAMLATAKASPPGNAPTQIGSKSQPVSSAASGALAESRHSTASPPNDSIPPAIPELGPMIIGRTEGYLRAEVSLDPQSLTRHTAIFGANGSGKTVLAMTIVEMLLERGVSAVLFDRKGDLANYASEDAWNRASGEPDERSRRSALRERLDIHLYTPGCPTGRPLVLPLLPEGLGKLDADEQHEQARQAAAILCSVCNPTPARIDMFATVLCRAVELICADGPHSLDDLEAVLLEAPPELLSRLPAHAPKHCEEVGRRLNERRVAHGRLFSDHGETLDLDRMLQQRAGRAQLSIINTQFLDADASLIWVAQFLAAAGRFIQTSPRNQLQALLMFDEADQYIPATSKPVTKPGMENLLRRARAAGVGIMLASQNVGDFDYKALDNITTVFAGKLTTARALEKLKSRLGDSVDRLSRKASGQFIMAVENDVREIKANMCLVRPETLPRDQIESIAARGARRG